MMRSKPFFWGAVLIGALCLTACSDDDETAGSPDGQTTQQDQGPGSQDGAGDGTATQDVTHQETGNGTHDAVVEDGSTVEDGGNGDLAGDTAPAADKGPPVPSDPMICKPCDALEDCASENDNEYLCMTSWYQSGDGPQITEKFCALVCDEVACPEGFACETVNDANGDPVADLCIPQPHGLCSEL